MKAPKSEEWQDVGPINAFTSRNTAMKNLNTGEAVQFYSANTKIVVVQKYVSPEGTYYRTRSAEHHNLNWAFEASALGLPNEVAPSAPSQAFFSLDKTPLTQKPKKSRKPTSAKKQTASKTVVLPKDGGGKRHRIGWISKLFRRKDG